MCYITQNLRKKDKMLLNLLIIGNDLIYNLLIHSLPMMYYNDNIIMMQV